MSRAARIVVTEGDILDALVLARTPSSPAGARTVQQLAATSGLSEGAVRTQLRRLHAEGRIVVHRVAVTRIDGQRAIVPAYTVLPGKVEKPRRSRATGALAGDRRTRRGR